ncbi:hypothetical protein FRB95_002612 [Tulasnella sp. JGI-2019a]|nr:hypothetical protein FRB95_002612 [Tulasnella sp. JGI-2019a]
MARHRKQRWSDDNRVHLNRGNQDRASEPAGAAGEYLDRRQRQHGRWRLCPTDYIQGRHPSGGWAAYGGGLLADGNATAELGPVSHWESSSGILRLRNEDPGAHTFEKEGEELNAGDREVVSRDRRSQQSMKRGTLGDKDGLSLQQGRMDKALECATQDLERAELGLEGKEHWGQPQRMRGRTEEERD